MIAAVAFDLDDTLAESKSAMAPAVATLVAELAMRVPVGIISGGTFGQFREQVIRFLPDGETVLSAIHLMPTCGARYYRFDDDDWRQLYALDLDEVDRVTARAVLERVARELGLWESDARVAGERIEDRGTQVTFSALGQHALVDHKKAWDPTGSKRGELHRRIQAELPHLEVKAGGSTSIDITRAGIDKAFGIRRFAELIDVDLSRILFIGDQLRPGGNDYPVVALGVQLHAVSGYRETESYLPSLIESIDAAASQVPT